MILIDKMPEGVPSNPAAAVYWEAANARRALHEIFIHNKYGLAAFFMVQFRNNPAYKFRVRNAPDKVFAGGDFSDSIVFDYKIEDMGIDRNHCTMHMQAIDTIMYVELLNTFVGTLTMVVNTLYDKIKSLNLKYYDEEEFGPDEIMTIEEDLECLHTFINEHLPKAKSSVALLFDLKIAFDYFIVTI